MSDHLEILRQHNAWRRGDETMVMADPRELGLAIDAMIAEVEFLREQIAGLRNVVTSYHETKEAFIGRMRTALDMLDAEGRNEHG